MEQQAYRSVFASGPHTVDGGEERRSHRHALFPAGANFSATTLDSARCSDPTPASTRVLSLARRSASAFNGRNDIQRMRDTPGETKDQ